ncbi:hypothetical protein [Microlunatus parietis]|uniref:Uncharacterized protein n=1 Tax=Microlunatus parietis TaxID=682979 RepID=A0A7Y9IE36_9ACTN|nr:hypothetical protein [Microlunatus parietis]NYE74916.1 hypothetical protein [Microlunatus parietis]
MIRTQGRHQRGQATLEYVAAIAAAAVIVIGVVISLAAQHSEFRSLAGSALCKVITLGSAGCSENPSQEQDPEDPEPWVCTVFGWGCGGNEDGADDTPWYCDLFGIGCPDDQADPPVDLPQGLDADSDLVETMLSTERGRLTLQWLADQGIEVEIDPNATGAYWDGTKIVLGPGYEDAAVLVHEANHARYTAEGRSADISNPDRDAYVRAAIDEEIDGTIQQIYAAREFRAAGHDAATNQSEQNYENAYEQAIQDGRTEAEADRAGRAAVAEGFYNGSITTSNNGQSYVDYYGDAWDRVH